MYRPLPQVSASLTRKVMDKRLKARLDAPVKTVYEIGYEHGSAGREPYPTCTEDYTMGYADGKGDAKSKGGETS